ncbi:MAG: TetR/AcrR family transcriptional regulator [Spirochaetota bacterium]
MRSEDKRRSILAAAKSAFAAYGYRKTTVVEIAEMVGMTKSNLYFYFPSKHDLYEQVVRMSLLTWQQSVAKAAKEQPGIRQRFIMLARMGFTYLREDEELSAMVIQDSSILSLSKRDDRFLDVNAQSLGLLMAVLNEGIAAGVFRTVDVQLTGEFLFSLYMMMLLKTYVKREENTQQQFEEALEIIVRGLDA